MYFMIDYQFIDCYADVFFVIVPGKAPRSVQVTAYPTKALMKWKVVNPSFQYGHQIKYRIVVENLRTKEIDYSHDRNVHHQATVDYQQWLLRLKGLTEYQVNVSLINEVGEGPINSLLFSTPEGG